MRQLPGWTEPLEQAWQARAEALDAYRGHLHSDTGIDINAVLESLLHMHHNRAIGIAPDHPLAAHPDACLFNGTPAVAFVLRATGNPAYVRPPHTLDEHIAHLARRRLDTAHQRIDDGLAARLREFDLINGLTGIGAYLLHTGHDALLHDVLSYLVRLVCEPITFDGEQLPAWWTGNEPADRPCPQWPGGHANLSIAHGIAVISGVKPICQVTARSAVLTHEARMRRLAVDEFASGLDHVRRVPSVGREVRHVRLLRLTVFNAGSVFGVAEFHYGRDVVHDSVGRSEGQWGSTESPVVNRAAGLCEKGCRDVHGSNRSVRRRPGGLAQRTVPPRA